MRKTAHKRIILGVFVIGIFFAICVGIMGKYENTSNLVADLTSYDLVYAPLK